MLMSQHHTETRKQIQLNFTSHLYFLTMKFAGDQRPVKVTSSLIANYQQFNAIFVDHGLKADITKDEM